jgi:hypothetical protein
MTTITDHPAAAVAIDYLEQDKAWALNTLKDLADAVEVRVGNQRRPADLFLEDYTPDEVGEYEAAIGHVRYCRNMRRIIELNPELALVSEDGRIFLHLGWVPGFPWDNAS